MKLYMVPHVVALVLSLVWIETSLAFQQEGGISLTYKLEKGKTYRYASQSDIQSVQTMMGNEVSTTIGSNSVARLTVEDVDKEGNITIVTALDSIVVKSHSPQRDTTMVNPFGIVGKRTRDLITKYGQTLKSTIIDTVRMPMGMGGRRVSASSFLLDFGDKAVKVGDSWDRTKTDSLDQMGGKMYLTSHITYTFVEPAEMQGYKCYKITSKGTTSYQGKGQMMGMSVFTEGTGTVNGTIYFAPDEGILVESESTSQQELTSAMTGQQNMTIPISQSIKSTTTLQK